MSISIKSVVRIIGIFLIIMSASFVPSLLVAVIYDEKVSVISFIATMIPCLIIGLIIIKTVRPSLTKLKVRDGFLIVSLCWILASLIGAVPLIISGAIPNPIDAIFEMCSGFSTTGASILTDIESLPQSMLFLRSFSHWLGGMGIIVFLMALMPGLGIGGQIIASAETPGPTLDKLTPRFYDTARSLYLLYIAFTAIETVLLLFGGMNLFDALIQTFGTVGTGGFSNYSDSIAHFNSPYVEWVITIFMVLCGINFNLYFVAARQGLARVFKDSEFKLYILILVTVTVLIIADLCANRAGGSGSETIRDAAFQVSSIMTSTGYATTDYDLWPTFCKMLLFMLMLVGASSSSTGGGVKVIRILVALKLVKRGFSLKVHPNRIVPVTINGRALAQETVTNITNFIFMFIAVTFGGSLLISLDGYDMVTSVSAVLACIGNIGPGFNLVGPAMNFSIFSGFSKIVLSFLMIAGRLELFTFFMLFSRHYWNSNKA